MVDRIWFRVDLIMISKRFLCELSDYRTANTRSFFSQLSEGLTRCNIMLAPLRAPWNPSNITALSGIEGFKRVPQSGPHLWPRRMNAKSSVLSLLPVPSDYFQLRGKAKILGQRVAIFRLNTISSNYLLCTIHIYIHDLSK